MKFSFSHGSRLGMLCIMLVLAGCAGKKQRVSYDRHAFDSAIKDACLNTHTLPSWTLVDMAIGYDLSKVGIKGLSAQLNVNNLTDKSYVAACNSLSYCYFGAERSIVGSVSWKF